MDVKEERHNAVLTLTPAGRLDAAASGEFQQRVVELVNAGERRIVVDLASTEDISAAGLRVLLMLSKKLESMGGRLVLCSLSERVHKAFDVAGFIHMVEINIAPTAADAIRQLSADEAVARVADLAARLLAKKDPPPGG